MNKEIRNDHPRETIWDKRAEWARERVMVPHEPLHEHPEFVSAIGVVARNLNTLLTENSALPVEVDLSQIRFIDESVWEDVASTVDLGDTDSVGGFYDSRTTSVFMRHNKELFEDPDHKLWNIYGVSHELGHRVTPDLEQLSFHLSEGIADFIARKVLTPEVFTMLNLPPTSPIPFCRDKQLAMIDYLRMKDAGKVYRELLKKSLRGVGYVQAYLNERYGSAFMSLLRDSSNEGLIRIVDYLHAN